MQEFTQILASARLKPIVTYDFIVYPFNLEVWEFVLGCILAQFSLLQIMQYVWCKVSGKPNLIDYIYEGA